MDREEIQKALKIIKEPVIVNCTTYHYFDQENYDKLQRIYDNCLWLINNEEQLIQNSENQQQEIIYLNKKIKKLEEANKILSKEITNGNVVGQGMITECCGIPLGDIPKLVECEQRNKNAINCLNNVLTEAYLDESSNVDIALVEYAVSLLLGEK